MKPLAAAGLLVAGAVTGLASVAVHGLWWGLVLAVAATLLVLLWLPAGWWSRLAFALGWVGLVGWLVNPRPEGDYAISGDLAGLTLLGLGVVVVVVGLGTLPRPARRVHPEA